MNEVERLPTLLEICVGSVADAAAAAAGGADRLELCSALELGGLTPSLGLIEQVIAKADLPTIVMIRPRAGGFLYCDSEFRCMLRDAELALAAGASGIVFGCLTGDGAIDRARSKEMVGAADGREAVFHRAFDFVPDRDSALEELIDLGVARVLTTGGAASAVEGVEALAQLNKQADGRIQILPGGGITAANVTSLLAKTGCRQVHAGATMSALDESIGAASAASLCDLRRLAAGELRIVDRQAVAALVQAL